MPPRRPAPVIIIHKSLYNEPAPSHARMPVAQQPGRHLEDSLVPRNASQPGLLVLIRHRHRDKTFENLYGTSQVFVLVNSTVFGILGERLSDYMRFERTVDFERMGDYVS